MTTDRKGWADLSLASQFALAGGVVMLIATVVVGFWVAARIEDVVVRNTANATALYMESFIAPLAQDLATSDHISDANLAAIERLLTDTALGSRVVSFKIWVKGPKVAAASNAEIVGKTFPITDDIKQAWKGQVVGSFDKLNEAENLAEQAMNMPLLQIYAPIRAHRSGDVIAIAEVYENAAQLKTDLSKVRMTSWLAVFVVMAAIGGSLFAIVLRGSRVIDRQLVDLSDATARNVTLRLKVQGAAARFSQMNDQALRRIGADLHDGPAQLMGFAALRLDALRKDASPRAQAEIDSIEGAVKEAMQEIRTISRGVSLPDIERRPLAEVIHGLVDAHAARTHSEVKLRTVLTDHEVPIAVKICVGRVVQEGLTNAWRHAAGRGQEVSVVQDDGTLTVFVRDTGPGVGGAGAHGQGAATAASDDAAAPAMGFEALYGLGLAGLAGRVESLGGALTLGERSDGRQGSELRMVLDLRGVE